MSFLINPYVFQAEVAGANSILAHATMASGIIGYWPLTTDGSVPDRTNRYDATIVGSAPYTTSGIISGGYSFNGSTQGITTETQIDINDYSYWTVSAWHYIESGATGTTVSFTFGTSSSSNYYIMISYNCSTTTWDLLDRTTSSRRDTYDDSGAAIGAWTHVTLTYDNGTYTLYLDNVSRATLVATPSSNINTFGIGMLDRTTDYFGSEASISSEVGLWDRVLSSDEISDLYNSGSGLPWQVLPFSESATLTDNLVTYYQAEGQSFLDTWGANNGTNNGATWLDTGKVDHGFDFDGTNDYIDLGDLSALEGIGAISLSFWIKQGDLSGSEQLVYDFSATAADQGIHYFPYTDGNTYVGVDGNTNRIYFTTATYITVDTWHHVVVVFDGSGVGNSGRLKVYIDDTLVSGTYTGTIGTTTTATIDEAYLGQSGKETRFYDGSLDEFGIWTKALSTTEITALYGRSADSRRQFQDSTTLNDAAHYFSFTNAAESDVSGASGTVTGATYNATGSTKAGGAYYDFDGTNDGISWADSADLDFAAADSFSISLWAKRDGTGTEPLWFKVVPNNGVGYRAKYSVDKVECSIEDSGGNTEILADTAITDTDWHHIVFVRDVDTDKLYLYIDGASAATAVTDTTTGTLANSENLFLGEEDRIAGNTYFDGSLAEFGIWRRALTSDEVTELYNSGSGLAYANSRFDGASSLTTSLEAFYPLEGQSCIDVSGNGNDGTNNGATWTDVGRVDHCMSFITNDYIALPFSMASEAEGTIAFWMKSGQSTANTAMFSSRGASGNFLQIINAGSDGFLATFRIYNGTAYEVQSTTTDTAGVDVWYHVVAKWNASGIFIYVNGVQEDTDAGLTSGTPTFPNNIDVGRRPTGANFYDGELDEIGVWSKALTDDEITELYTTSEGLRFRGKFQDSSTLSDVDHYWSFENAAESDVSGQTGTVNGATKVTTGITGNAYSFDGTNDYITLPSSTEFNFGNGNDSSYSFWLYMDNITTQNRILEIGRYTSGSRTIFADFTYKTGDFLEFEVEGEGDGAAGRSQSVTNESLSLNTWHHVVLVWNASASRADIFINGTEATYSTQTTNSTGLVSGTGGNNYIGKITTTYFAGDMSDIGFWDRALTSDEITELYNSGLGLRLN